MTRLAIILAAALLAGCSSFKMGALVYIPHGQQAEVRVGPPAAAQAASAPAK